MSSPLTRAPLPAPALDVGVTTIEHERALEALIALVTCGHGAAHPPVVLVLDIGGRAHEPALKRTVWDLAGEMRDEERLGIVVFDGQASLVRTIGPRGTGLRLEEDLERFVRCGGPSNLSAGLLRGLAAARRAGPATPARIVVVTAGHPDCGLLHPGQLELIALRAREEGVTTSFVATGRDADPVLLERLATVGGGTFAFAPPDDLASTLVEVALPARAPLAQAATVAVRWNPHEPFVGTVSIGGRDPIVDAPGRLVADLGDFPAGARATVGVRVDVASTVGCGLRRVAEVEVAWTATSSLREERVVVPLSVGLVPGESAGTVRIGPTTVVPASRCVLRPELPA